jgi:hypothetical protein
MPTQSPQECVAGVEPADKSFAIDQRRRQQPDIPADRRFAWSTHLENADHAEPLDIANRGGECEKARKSQQSGDDLRTVPSAKSSCAGSQLPR